MRRENGDRGATNDWWRLSDIAHLIPRSKTTVGLAGSAATRYRSSRFKAQQGFRSIRLVLETVNYGFVIKKNR